MSEQSNNSESHYENLSDKQKEVAPKIEELLNGLSVADAIKLLYRIRRAIEEKGIIKST